MRDRKLEGLTLLMLVAVLAFILWQPLDLEPPCEASPVCATAHSSIELTPPAFASYSRHQSDDSIPPFDAPGEIVADEIETSDDLEGLAGSLPPLIDFFHCPPTVRHHSFFLKLALPPLASRSPLLRC
jgi:hypothetical protein